MPWFVTLYYCVLVLQALHWKIRSELILIGWCCSWIQDFPICSWIALYFLIVHCASSMCTSLSWDFAAQILRRGASLTPTPQPLRRPRQALKDQGRFWPWPSGWRCLECLPRLALNIKHPQAWHPKNACTTWSKRISQGYSRNTFSEHRYGIFHVYTCHIHWNIYLVYPWDIPKWLGKNISDIDPIYTWYRKGVVIFQRYTGISMEYVPISHISGIFQ